MLVTRVHYQPFLSATAKGAQIWRYIPECRRPRHFHAEPEINLVVAGSARFAVGEAVLALRPGHLLAFPPGQDHVLLGASSDLDLFSFSLAPELSGEALGRNAAGVMAGPLRFRLSPDQLAALSRRCAEAWQEGASAMANAVADIWTLANQLRDSGPKVHVLTRRTLEHVARAPDLRRRDLARLLRTSPEEASRRFRADTGMTIGSYRSRVRLLGFIRRMDQGLKHSDAAAASGFGSYSQCHRVFRDVVGCSPRTFFDGGLRRTMEAAYEPLVLPTQTYDTDGGQDLNEDFNEAFNDDFDRQPSPIRQH
jgi:AraC-like DNA-binding protein